MELKEFTLPFVGLKHGKHNFSFAIDNKLFEHFGFDDFHKTKLEGKLVLDKKPSFLELHFDVKGKVILSCDVSTELFSHTVKSNYDMIVKFGATSETDPDEILIIPEGSYQINVAQYFYEMVVLSIPLKRVHPGIKNGTLKNDILSKLEQLDPQNKKTTINKDPRWEKLESLL
jgi:uncharacterized metal-binding protein YceD (DUF177 family)